MISSATNKYAANTNIAVYNISADTVFDSTNSSSSSPFPKIVQTDGVSTTPVIVTTAKTTIAASTTSYTSASSTSVILVNTATTTSVVLRTPTNIASNENIKYDIIQNNQIIDVGFFLLTTLLMAKKMITIMITTTRSLRHQI